MSTPTTMRTEAVWVLLCLPALLLAQEGEFDAEARIAEYAKEFPPTEADFHYDSMRVDPNKTEIGAFAAITNPKQLWTNRILPYQIVGIYTEEQKRRIRVAAYEVSRLNGCIRLVETAKPSNRLMIRQCGNACDSYVGMRGGQQRMCVADWCTGSHGTLMHTFIHALGFTHEHQRYDREAYIYVNHKNIKRQYWSMYTKLPQSQWRLLTSYDYGSIMHYGAYSRSTAINPQQPIIVPRVKGVNIGQREGMSLKDRIKIQILYGCRKMLDSAYFNNLAGLA